MWIWHLLASKVPTAGGSTVPFRALSQNKSSVSLCVVLESVPLRREKFMHAQKTESWYLLRVLFKIYDEHPCSFIWELI